MLDLVQERDDAVSPHLGQERREVEVLKAAHDHLLIELVEVLLPFKVLFGLLLGHPAHLEQVQVRITQLHLLRFDLVALHELAEQRLHVGVAAWEELLLNLLLRVLDQILKLAYLNFLGLVTSLGLLQLFEFVPKSFDIEFAFLLLFRRRILPGIRIFRPIRARRHATAAP